MFQGAIQGPGEFAEGLALGVTSLFSHAVGGTAGAVSRITGTLGTPAAGFVHSICQYLCLSLFSVHSLCSPLCKSWLISVCSRP